MQTLFHVAMRKTFHTLRFDYLPEFIESKDTQQLLMQASYSAEHEGEKVVEAPERRGVGAIRVRQDTKERGGGEGSHEGGGGQQVDMPPENKVSRRWGAVRFVKIYAATLESTTSLFVSCVTFLGTASDGMALLTIFRRGARVRLALCPRIY